MMKVILSDRAYLKPDDELIKRFRTNLSYEFEPSYTNGTVKHVHSWGPVMRGTYWIPVERLDLLQGYEYEIVDKRAVVPADVPEPFFDLREDQQGVLDRIDDTCLLNASPGWGKTITALAIAHKLGQKTLVVCTTTTIRDMWIDEIEKFMDFTPGIIGSGKMDIEPPIVVGNIQTLTRNADKFKDTFGTVIFDECFDYETLVLLADGSTRKIGALVNNKETPLVRSYNEHTGKWEERRVLRHFKNPQSTFRKLQIGGSTLKCTEDHNIYVDIAGVPTKKRAKDLVIGDRVVSFVRHKDSYSIKDWGLLIALALGDGSLGRTKEGIRLSVVHGEKQLDYLDSKTTYMGNCIIEEGKSGYCDNKVYRATTKTFKDDIGLYDMLYGSKRHKSSLPEKLFKYIDWRTLAYLIMDDGSYQGGNITLSLCEVDLDSLQRLGKHFFHEDEYTVYTCNKGYNYIKLKAAAVSLIKKNCIQEFHPDLLYKLGAPNTLQFYNPTGSSIFSEYTVLPYKGYTEVSATGGNRFNIEVEGNHNYVANGKLVANCHHCPASTFLKLLLTNKARYKIGLSGTLHRKDGMHALFKDFFGFNVLQPAINNTMPPTVHLYQSGCALPGNMMIPWANRVTELTQNEMYRKEVQALAGLYSKLGHKVIVVSDRIEFLTYIHENTELRSALFIGASDLAERTDTLGNMTDDNLDLICASQSLFSEGVSQNNLSCMILATPISDNQSLISQLAGRIMRKYKDKLPPVLVDMNLLSDSGKNQARKRKAIYALFGWSVENIDLQNLMRQVGKSIEK